MADIKSRTPYRLSDEDYDEWFTRWVAWFLALPNTPAFANWLRSGLFALDANYHDKLVEVQEAKLAQEAATKAWTQAVKNLRELLAKLRISLPTLTPGDDSVLDTFKLRKKVPPHDADDLLLYAEVADNVWQTLSGEPAYAPFADRLNLIAPGIADINAKRLVMGQAILNYSTVTDDKVAAREACNTRERAVFNFFRGEGKPPEFWTSSVYGMPGGGEGGEGEPERPDWPGPVEIFTLEFLDEGEVEIVYSGVKEATIGWLHRRKVNTEDWILVADDLPMNPEDILPFRERHVPVGIWEYRFIPMRGVEKGVASFAIVEVTE